MKDKRKDAMNDVKLQSLEIVEKLAILSTIPL